MIKLTFLGTSGSTPTKEKGMPGISIEREGDVFLFDCGEGTQRQMMQYGVNLARIKAIFITHTHGDHIIGLAGLVRTLALNKRQQPLQIFVPQGEEKKILALMTFDKAILDYPIIIDGIKAGRVYKGKDFTISAFKLDHNVPTYGYIFEEDTKTKFMKEKCHKLGLKGTMFADLLKKGTLKVKDKTIKLKDVSFVTAGKKIVYATDTRPALSTAKAAQGADVLIHESSFTEQLAALAKDRYHCTAKGAAQIAKKAKCKRLFLFHISVRYKNPTPLIKEAKQIFPNTEAAADGMKIFF